MSQRVGFPTLAHSRLAADGEPGKEVIQLPLRWCACEGSPAVTDPGSLGEPDTDNVLWRRHERATDRIWLPGAAISFRSGFTAEIRDEARFPIIEDPNPPSAGGPGELGDILAPSVSLTEIMVAVANCEKAWDILAKGLKVPLLGPVVINIRRFVNSDGIPSSTVGRLFSLRLDPALEIICKDPTKVISADSAAVLITDYFFTREDFPEERPLAHELGHALFLGHGNGLDDDGDMMFDRFCEDDETNNDPPTVMHGTINKGTNLVTELQRGMSRAIAAVHPGAKKDPPARLIDGPTIADQRVDTVRDIANSSVDILSVTMTENTVARTTSFSHRIFGVIPLAVNNQYAVFADLDGNPATGGAPSSLDFDTGFQGAELVTRVVVRQSGGMRIVVPTVWRFQSGAFVEVADPRIRADVSTSFEVEEMLPAFDFVYIQMPNDVRGPAGTQARIQAIAQLPGATGRGPLDRLPDGQADGSLGFFLVPQNFSVCDVTPSPVQPGAMAKVEVNGLVPNRMAKVLIGDQLVATGLTDGQGNTTIQFPVPFDARPGLRLVTVGTVGSALTADCALEIAGAPGFKCDTICFRSPQYYLLNLNRLPQAAVLIAGVNVNSPVSTSNLHAIKLALEGGRTATQVFNQQFVAAQLSLALTGGTASAPAVNAQWSPLHCYGLNMAPIMLTNGTTLTLDYMLKDLFQQARLASNENRQADLFMLAKIFSLLNSAARFGCRTTPMAATERLVCTLTVSPNGSTLCCGVEGPVSSRPLGCISCDVRGQCVVTSQ
jgi:hypothetical protein